MNRKKLKALHQAAKNHDSLKLVRMFSKGFDVNWSSSTNQTALHTAAMHNNYDSHYSTIETLLKHGANVNARNADGNTAMNCLTNKTDVRIVELFLNYQVDVNLKNNTGCTPIYNAIETKDVEIVRLLVDHGANVNNVDDSKITPLHRACLNLHPDLKIIKLLLEKGANANLLDCAGSTPFMKLIEFSRVTKKMLNFFFEYTDINVIDSRGYNILYYARESEKFCEYGIIEHVAKLQALGLPVHPEILEYIKSFWPEYNSYFENCKTELSVAKNTKILNSWITFFDVLVDSKIKLKNYAGNQDMIASFENGEWADLKKFRIYGPEMKKKVKKGIITRRIFDESADLLSYNIPIFGPNHLIIRNVFDSLTFKDYVVFLSNG